jgi:hypothetical protein
MKKMEGKKAAFLVQEQILVTETSIFLCRDSKLWGIHCRSRHTICGLRNVTIGKCNPTPPC